MLLYVVIRPIISNSVVEAEVGWGEERCRQLNCFISIKQFFVNIETRFSGKVQLFFQDSAPFLLSTKELIYYCKFFYALI